MTIQNIYDIDTLLRETGRGMRPRYLFFWKHLPRRVGEIGKCCLSQWWEAPFKVEGVTYLTAEHYMMAEKARLFGDKIACEKILSSRSPEEAKRVGREARGFDEEIWSRHRFGVVLRGNEAKFGQSERLRRFLLDTKDFILAEASPYDRIWGIGLTEDDERATKPEEWRGLNLLGFALMKVRREFGG